MAKISELPVASSVTGVELVPIVQSSTTKSSTLTIIKTWLATFFALKGANSDITSLSSLSTPLSVAQGGTGDATLTGIAYGNGTSPFTVATADQINTIVGGTSFLYGTRTVNGSCEISQVNGTTAVTPNTNSWPIDQWFLDVGVASKLTAQQVVDAPAGLKNSLKISVATQYSPGVAEQFWIGQSIEGSNVIDFQLGTVGSVIITLSNWIKGSIAGTYSVSIRNSAQNRSYIGTITVTTSWAQVKLTLTGDVTGTWLTDTNTGLIWAIDLGSGTNFNTTANTWQAGNFLRTSGSVTFVNQVNGSTLNITGLDIRLGSNAPLVFERRDVGEELRRCQRYLPLWNFPGGFARGPIGHCISATDCVITFKNPTTTRIPVTGLGPIGSVYVLNAGGSPVAVTISTLAGNVTQDTTSVDFTVAAGLVAGNATTFLGANPGPSMVYGTGAQL